jgi:hydroxyisourate hydrolase
MKRHAPLADVHSVDEPSGRSALHKAAFWGHTHVVRYLIDECKLNPNLQDTGGDTALHDAVRFGHLDVVKALASITDLSIRNREGLTPADVAVQMKKDEVGKLLNPKAATGFLTCHVLDTARGCPAAGLRLTLRRKGAGDTWETLGSWVTNEDGRLPGGPALKGENHLAGVYEWTFFVGEYFASVGVPTARTPFLDEVPIRLGIDDPDSHYHVPLLVSPWSFSTYRGS